MLLVPAAALAHARLIRVDPGNGAVLPAPPTAVRLFFDDVIQEQPGMRAVREDGTSVLGGRIHVVGGRELVIPLRRRLPQGAYTVLWRVLSDDGHPVAGITTFAVGTGQARPRAALGAPAEQRAVPGFERWLFLSGVLLAVGLSVFRMAMPRETAPPLALLAASFALTAGGGAALVERASLSTRFGLVVGIAVGVASAGAVVSIAAAFLPRLAPGAWLFGLALVAMPSAAGHALDPGRPLLEFPVDVLHAAAASVWFGGVVAVVNAARHGAFRDDVLRRFSALALVAVVVLATTGLLRAFSELSSLDQVSGTSYGRLLILKTGLFGMLLALGWANRYRLIPTLARSAHRLRWNLRAEILLLLGVIAATAILTQTLPGRDQAIATPGAIGARSVREVPRDAVVLAQERRSLELAGAAVGSIRVGHTSLLWETIPYNGDSAALVERDLETQRTRTLARNVAPGFGLAGTSDWIVYATATIPVHLVAIDRRSGQLTVLGDSLAAPLAWRGARVAWAEQHGARQRVVVYDFRRHKAWTAADLPTCVERLCYRIGAVTLAKRGVVFDRGAIGSQASFIVRREFSATRLQFARVEHDPQPDLVPSIAGAFYYALSRGWFRWDFGTNQPRLVHLVGVPPLAPIDYDGRGWLFLQHRGCDDAVVERAGSSSIATVASPAPARAIAGVGPGFCVHVTNVTWADNRPITTWTIVPRATHSPEAIGAITIGPPSYCASRTCLEPDGKP